MLIPEKIIILPNILGLKLSIKVPFMRFLEKNESYLHDESADFQ